MISALKILRNLVLKTLHMYNENEEIIKRLRKRGVIIGENVDIINSYIDGGFGFLCSIGNNVTLTGVRILTHDASTKKFLGYSKIGKVNIGNNVFIGNGSILLPNIQIGNNVIIGAGTIVAKDVPDNVVIAGNPWRVLCTCEEYIERNKNKMGTSLVSNIPWYKYTSQENMDILLKGINFPNYGFNI